MPTFAGARIYGTSTTDHTNATWTKVPMDTFHFGDSAYHDTTDDRFVAQIAGWYKVCWGAGVLEDCHDDDVFIQLRKNSVTASTSSGSTIVQSHRKGPASTSSPLYRGTGTVYMEVDDYLEIYQYTNRGAASTPRSGIYVSIAAYLDVETTFVGVGAKMTSNDSTTSGVAHIPSWDTTDFDTDSFWSSTPNPSRLTVPSGQGGIYRVDVCAAWPQAMGDAYTIVWAFKNGAGASASVSMPEANHWYWVSWGDLIELAATDYVEMQVQQNDGTRNLWGHSGLSGTRMTLVKVGE